MNDRFRFRFPPHLLTPSPLHSRPPAPQAHRVTPSRASSCSRSSRCRIRDAKLRDEAVRSAKSACLNCAEGAGRVTRADKARAFAIARAEAVEAAAAVEIAALCGDAPAERGARGGAPRRPARVAAHAASCR